MNEFGGDKLRKISTRSNVKLSEIKKSQIVQEAEEIKKNLLDYFNDTSKYFATKSVLEFSESLFTKTLEDLLSYAKGEQDLLEVEIICNDIINIFWKTPFEEESDVKVEWQKWEKTVTGAIVRGALTRQKYQLGKELLSGPEVSYITEMALETINKHTKLGYLKGTQNSNRSWVYDSKDVKEYVNQHLEKLDK